MHSCLGCDFTVFSPGIQPSAKASPKPSPKPSPKATSKTVLLMSKNSVDYYYDLTVGMHACASIL